MENQKGPLVSRRNLLRGVLGGAALLGLGGGMPLLSGCGSGDDDSFVSTGNDIEGYTLFVSTFLARSVEAYNASTGAYLGTVVPASANPAVTTAGLAINADNNLYVCSPGSDALFLYNTSSRTLIRDCPTPAKGLLTPHSGAIGPDGHLYVANGPSLNGNIGKGIDTIEKYDGKTGDLIGTFAEIKQPVGTIFGPDGDLYVSSALEYASPIIPTFTAKSDFVTRLDGETGADLGIVVKDIKNPFSMEFHPSGDLLVTEHFESRIQRYNVRTGALVGTFCSVPFPVGVAYGPDGDLYVGSFADKDPFTTNLAPGTGSIRRFDGNTGAAKGILVSGMPYAGFLAFARVS